MEGFATLDESTVAEITAAGDIAQSRSLGSRKRNRGSTHQKKTVGMPKRPLSAYNIFYKRERPRLLQESAEHVGYKDLGRIIGKRWRTLNDEERRECERLAEKEVIHYRREMKVYKATQSKKETESSPDEEKTMDEFLEKDSKQEQTTQHQKSQHASNSPGGMGLSNQFFSLKKAIVTDGKLSSSAGSTVSPDFDVNAMIPPGSEYFFTDVYGYEQKYQINYICYKMARSQARKYVGLPLPIVKNI